MTAFRTPYDIANRALGQCGLGGSNRIVAFTDDTKAASETGFVYDKLREAELRRNVWRFATRKTVLRPVGPDTQYVNFPVWAIGTTYGVNSLVSFGGEIWYSPISGNLGNQPDINTPATWVLYFGPVVAGAWATYGNPNSPPLWLIGTNYAFNALVSGSDGFSYQSLTSGNIGNNPVTDGGVHWQQLAKNSTGYFAGELVYDSSNVVYLSLISGNGDDPPTSNWLTLTGATLTPLNLIYPVGSGPVTQSITRNVYFLPNGFMRAAPQDPKAGSTSYLGAPSGLRYDDWEWENDFIVTQDSDPIVLRFVANVSDVTRMDPMFCEGLACRVALAICETLTQSGEKLTNIATAYQRFMSEARTVNGIETGATEPPEDDYLACRV